MTRTHAWTVLGVAILLAAAIGATWQIATLVEHLTNGVPHVNTGNTGTAAVLLLIPALVVGQMLRGWGHARGIRKSHFAAIKGKGLALILLALTAFVLFGGAR